MDQSLKKICIIGAGPCGLVTARHLQECQNSEITVFEAQDQVGGLWVYDDKNQFNPKYDIQKRSEAYYQINGHFHNSIYPNLLSNIPYFFMAFKDLSHADVDKDTSIFITLSQHKAYLDAYADKFELKKKIRFNTLVKSVRLYENLPEEEQETIPDKRKFVVRAINTKREEASEEKVYSFDYVVICNGHYSKPYIPEIKGFEKFKGDILTAKDYRQPYDEPFVNKKVLVLGTSFSATDVVTQVLENALTSDENKTHVTLVGKEVKNFQDSADFERLRSSGKFSIIKGEIQEIIDERTIKTTDGNTHEIDTIVFCTGYEYSFPFLDFQTDNLIDFPSKHYRGKFIAPLYKRFISIREPNLFFINLSYFSINTPFSEVHAMIAKAIIDGKMELPSKNEMIQSFLDEADAAINYEGKSVVSLLRFPSPFSDVKVWEDQRNLLKSIYPNNEEKAKEYYNAFIGTYMKMGEFFFTGSVLGYKNFDYHLIFPKELRNTTEFI